MAISSKDFESLWQRYKVEAVPVGISVNQFFRIQGAIVTATYRTFVESCKLMAPLDFFRRFFDMIVVGRRDYALMTESLLVKPV